MTSAEINDGMSALVREAENGMAERLSKAAENAAEEKIWMAYWVARRALIRDRSTAQTPS